MPRSFIERARIAMLAIVLAGCQSMPSGDGAALPEPGSAPATFAPEPADVDARTRALFDDALTAIEAERFRDAARSLVELTSAHPELSSPWVNLGQVYVAMERLDEAEAAFARAIDTNPDNCQAYNQLGILSREQGDFAAAEANYLACIERVPGFREAYLNLGILYELYLGRFDQALAAYRRYQALSVAPDRRVATWVVDLERRISSG